MNKFTFKYSPLIWVLLTVISLLFAAAVATNLYDAIAFSGEGAARFILSLSMAILSALLLTLTVAAAIYSKYVVKGKFLYFRLGFLYTKTDINDIFQLTEFKRQNKLVMYFKNEKYSVAVIDEKYYNSFYEALKKVNPEITYTVQSVEE